jgi:hypothetical protein
MPNTFNKIASVTVGSGGSSTIDFTSIPSTYTDLCLKVSARGTQSAVYATYTFSFNGSTSNRSLRSLYGSGSSVVSSNEPSNIATDAVGSTATASTFSNTEIYISNYAGSINKSLIIDGVTENNATEAYTELYAALWSDTSAINRVTLTPITGTFAQHSTATLYGIKNS